ncbi:13151_t:CDS:2 [Entrophospora sp. SA101]|nr:13151_t:CDS:2 [Entrophospora sp. SA101]
MRKITIKFYDHQLNHKTKNLVYISDGDKEILSDGCRTPVNQIKSDKLLRAATESLASPDESNTSRNSFHISMNTKKYN